MAGDSKVSGPVLGTRGSRPLRLPIAGSSWRHKGQFRGPPLSQKLVIRRAHGEDSFAAGRSEAGKGGEGGGAATPPSPPFAAAVARTVARASCGGVT
jgi:hypothetical protein